jgi:hypothetical protein
LSFAGSGRPALAGDVDLISTGLFIIPDQTQNPPWHGADVTFVHILDISKGGHILQPTMEWKKRTENVGPRFSVMNVSHPAALGPGGAKSSVEEEQAVF